MTAVRASPSTIQANASPVLGPARAENTHMYFFQPKNKKIMDFHYFFMIDTAVLLQQEGRSEDSDWVLSQARQVFPTLASSIERDVKAKTTPNVARSGEAQSTEEGPRVPEQIAFPTFV